MSEKSEALRLAAELEACPTIDYKAHAVELRRLSIENERIGPLAERVLELKAQRDALLEALRWIDNVNAMDYEYQKVARAAIKAVEEGK